MGLLDFFRVEIKAMFSKTYKVFFCLIFLRFVFCFVFMLFYAVLSNNLLIFAIF